MQVSARVRSLLWLWWVLLLLPAASAVWADEVLISDDGRQIQVNGDGTWVQLSKDRFATTAGGQRIRLKPDGTWSTVGPGQTRNSLPGSATPRPEVSENTLHLAKVEILKRKIKRAKSVHAETNTIYHVRVLNESAEDVKLTSDLATSLSARSSTGAQFPIASVTFDHAVIKPGERGRIRVVAKGSPRWFGVKFISLEVAANALGNVQRRVLSKNMDEVEKRSVNTLSEFAWPY